MSEKKAREIMSAESLEILNKRRMNVSLMEATEEEYRANPAVSYSRLSDVEKIGLEAVHGTKKEDISRLRGVVLGSIVDDVVSNKLEKMPSYVVVVEKAPGSGTITEQAIDCLITKAKFKVLDDLSDKELEEFLKDNNFMRNGMNSGNFLKKMYNYEEYINSKRKHALNPKVMFVNKYDKSIIKKAIKRLRTNHLFKAEFVDFPSQSLIYQMKFLALVDGVLIKCMLDAVHINHIDKTIEPIDIKTGVLDKPERAAFMTGPYLTYNYYIQAGLYRKIVTEYFMHQVKYQDYLVLPFVFVYSTTNPKTALSVEELFVHTITEVEYMQSFKGFSWTDDTGNPVEKKGIGELFRFYRDNTVVDEEKQV